MPPLLDIDDVDPQCSVSMTWSIDGNGNMRHKGTGATVTDQGVEISGKEYKLSAEDVETEDKLGQGACGLVLKGRIKSTGAPVAIKTIKVDDKLKREQLLNEIKLLVQADGCPYLVQWYAAFSSRTKNMVNIVLEFLDAGSLAELKKRLKGKGVPVNYLACIAQQMMLGLHHLHSRKMLHRDIKPENILHSMAGEVKLTDFGIAKDLDNTLAVAGTFVGTVTYMSPERCQGQDYSLESDIWSIGMVIYELATGRYPFADVSSFPVLFDHLCEKPEPRLTPEMVTCPAGEETRVSWLIDFAALCLTRDVAKRPDAATLCKHEFVTQGVPSQAELSAFLKTLS